MSNERVSMVQECTDSYQVKERTDGGVDITIRVPKRFADLWIVKLSELDVSAAELNDAS